MSASPMLGVMLDCSRNAVYRPEAVRRLIDLLSKMGYNTLQLYTEDTYEVDGEPFFGYLRGRYTKAELRELDAYAASRGIELQPCIQTLAHLDAIFRWPTYSVINDQGNALFVGEERTYELIDRMFASCAECFTSRRIHIGMDEAFAIGRGKHLDKHGYMPRFDIILPHLQRVCKIAEKYGFHPMAWGDMFFRAAANGGWYGAEAHPTEELIAKIPEDLELFAWDYYHSRVEDYDKLLDGFCRFRRKIMFAGGAWTWTSATAHNDFSLRSTRAAIDSCRKHGISDVLITMWGDNGGEASAFSLLPSLFYAAELARGNDDMALIKARFREVIGEDFDKMMALDLPEAFGNYPYGENNAAKHGLYNDPFRGIMDKSLFPGGTAHFRRAAKKLRAYAREGGEFAYLFDLAAKLSSVMEIKYELGVRLHAAYEANDREGLAAAARDLRRAARRLEIYHEAYRKAWYYEKKNIGYEVQQIRLDGMTGRLKLCASQVEDYLAGRLDRLEEVEEEILPLSHRIFNWGPMTTACRL